MPEQDLNSLARDRRDRSSGLTVISARGVSCHEAHNLSEGLDSGEPSLRLTLILAESAIELVPNEIAGHPAVRSSARRKKRDPRQLILDQSYHHSAILKLDRRGVDRGRPDIAHFSLLLALGSPLSLERRLQCYVHTRDDHIIRLEPHARLPRNTDRFVSLLEQLYEESSVPPKGPSLMTLKRQSLKDLIEELSPDSVVALTTQGAPKPLGEIAEQLTGQENPVIMVGGFAEGHFSNNTLRLATQADRVDKRKLEAWTVVARAMYDVERAVGIQRF